MLVLYAALFVQIQLGQFKDGLDIGGREAPLIPLPIQQCEIEPREPWLACNFSAVFGGLLSLFIRTDMTSEQVFRILGTHDAVTGSFHSTTNFYFRYRVSVSYDIDFIDGKYITHVSSINWIGFR